MTDEETKRRILARRASLVAAAVAGLGTVTACDECGGRSHPGPCLSVEPISTAIDGSAAIDPDAAPRPCLSILRPKLDLGDDGGGAPKP